MVSNPDSESDDSTGREEPTAKYEVTVAGHKSVGPYPDTYGHGPLTLIGEELVVCLDCGYTGHDIRLFAHIDCEREYNSISQTWREWMDAEAECDALPESDGWG